LLEARLQRVIDSTIEQHKGLALTAAVLIGGQGRWSVTAATSESGGVDVASWSTGSVGKTVTAAQVLRLAEDGRVDLDAPASTYLPTDAGNANGATVRELLRMRSGITGHVAPDTRFEYANVDYVMLGRILEQVEGRPLGEVLTSGVLDVPGAERLTFPQIAGVENAAGPLQTDALSLARWGEALFGGRIVRASSLRAMTAFDADGYGMGVFDFSADFDRPAAGHLGVDEPASAVLVVLPADQLVVSVLATPLEWQDTERVAEELAVAVR